LLLWAFVVVGVKARGGEEGGKGSQGRRWEAEIGEEEERGRKESHVITSRALARDQLLVNVIVSYV
jgi:hypothetical protein